MNIGDKVLVTTNEWFFAPDGQQYRAVFGTIKGLKSDAETLGIKTNARSTNWYLEIGNMIVAGCQIFYVIKTDDVSLSAPTMESYDANGTNHSKAAMTRIYIAD